ncbi:hypothetical protein ACHAO1_002461 [Botrytis cinerea]
MPPRLVNMFALFASPSWKQKPLRNQRIFRSDRKRVRIQLYLGQHQSIGIRKFTTTRKKESLLDTRQELDTKAENSKYTKQGEVLTRIEKLNIQNLDEYKDLASESVQLIRMNSKTLYDRALTLEEKNGTLEKENRSNIQEIKIMSKKIKFTNAQLSKMKIDNKRLENERDNAKEKLASIKQSLYYLHSNEEERIS